MCRGRSEITFQGCPDSGSRSTVSCELCGEQAALYCQADNAFLCAGCDRSIHTANFLALRHVRRILCQTCRRFTRRYVVGASKEVKLSTALFSARAGTNAETRHPRRTFVFL